MLPRPGVATPVGEEGDVTTETAIAEDARIVASLDTEFQAAVKENDAATIDRILADDFLLVTGRGKTYTKADLLEEARTKRFVYERQEDSDQTVRVWGDTAVVTALLWAKGTEAGKPFDYKLWFSDMYLRTPTGWRYVLLKHRRPCPQAPKRSSATPCYKSESPSARAPGLRSSSHALQCYEGFLV